MWECNLSKWDLNTVLREHTLSTMQSIFRVWCEITFTHTPDTIEQILNMPLWGNSLIHQKNAPIWDAKLLTSNVNKVFDIVDPNTNKIYDIKGLYQNFGIDWDTLYYFGLRATILRTWRIEIKNMQINDEMDWSPKWEQNCRIPTKTFYWNQVAALNVTSMTLRYIWERELKIVIDEDTWKNNFVIFHKKVYNSRKIVQPAIPFAYANFDY